MENSEKYPDLVKYVDSFFEDHERGYNRRLKGFQDLQTLQEFLGGLPDGALDRILEQAREVLAAPVFDWVVVSEISGTDFESPDGAQMWLEGAVKALENGRPKGVEY